MAVKVSVKLDSKIFDRKARREALSSALGRSAREFKELTRVRMVASKPSGRVYPVYPRNLGFRREIRRSAWGQRPAVDTTTLINAIRFTKSGDFRAVVDIAPLPNRRNNQPADKYAAILQSPRFGRQIMTPEDAQIAETDLKAEIEKAVKRLI